MKARAMAAPYLAGLMLLVALPAAGALWMALTDFSGVGNFSYVGFDNFAELWRDSAFWSAIGNSLVYAAISVPARVAIAAGLALLLARRSRGVATARAAAYLPSVVPDAAYALLWLWILNPVYGPLAAGLRGLGLESTGLLTDPWATRVAIAGMGALQVGEAFVIALAARRSIPAKLYEAAEVDGAGAWFTMTRVSLPLMAPMLGLLALRDVILSFQINFVPALLITGGGPRYATTYLPLYIYESAFGYLRLGYAAAMSIVLFALTAGVVYVQYRLARRARLL